MQSLLEIDCIPAGMEWFPATDEPPWKLITTILDESDYYIVIVGGRYGSTDAEGLGFTEREYDYARPRIPGLAFLYDAPKGASPEDPEAAEKLKAFRDKIENDRERMFQRWSDAKELAAKVAHCITRLKDEKKSEGWIRDRYALTSENVHAIRVNVEAIGNQLATVSNQFEEIVAVQQSLGSHRAMLRNKELFDPIYATTAEGLMREPLEILDSLATGRLVVNEEWIGVAFDLLASAVRDRYDGVSTDDLEFWLDKEDPSAVKYLQRNSDLVEQGRMATRLFVLPSRRLIEQRDWLIQVLEEHTEAGIAWAVALQDEIPQRRGVWPDYGLFDCNRAASFFRLASGRKFEVIFHTHGRVAATDREIDAQVNYYYTLLGHCWIASESFATGHLASKNHTILDALTKTKKNAKLRRRGIPMQHEIAPVLVSEGDVGKIADKLSELVDVERAANGRRP
jgi:hypothetical protein